jgi:hypothetical protein
VSLLAVPQVSGWVLEVPGGRWKVILKPMRGNRGPYEVVVFNAAGQKLRYVGAPTAERAMEHAGTTIRMEDPEAGHFVHQLEAIGERLDRT